MTRAIGAQRGPQDPKTGRGEFAFSRSPRIEADRAERELMLPLVDADDAAALGCHLMQTPRPTDTTPGIVACALGKHSRSSSRLQLRFSGAVREVHSGCDMLHSATPKGPSCCTYCYKIL